MWNASYDDCYVKDLERYIELCPVFLRRPGSARGAEALDAAFDEDGVTVGDSGGVDLERFHFCPWIQMFGGVVGFREGLLLSVEVVGEDELVFCFGFWAC